MNDCNCKILGVVVKEIKYCSLHQSAPQLLEALREIVKSGVYPDCPACEIMYEIADNVIAVATGDDKDNG